MKYLLIILLLTTTAQAQVWDEFTRMDRLTHMGAGYVITGTTTSIAYNFTAKDWQAEMIGLFFGIAAGVAKEAFDSRTHEADMWDLGATVIGSTAAVITIRILPFEGRSNKRKIRVQVGM